MKREIYVLGLFFSICSVQAGLKFGSDDATLALSPTTTFTYQQSNTSELDRGIIQRDAGASFGDADSFTIYSGTLQQGRGVTAEVEGIVYGASSIVEGADSIVMGGDSSVNAKNGFLCYDLQISGTDNVLSGSFNLARPIILGEDAEVSLGLTAPLNNAIALDGGTVTLTNGLQLQSNVFFSGSGTVDAQDYKVTLGGYYASSLGTTVTWRNASDIQLQGSIALSGNWYFYDDACIKGNGATVDLRTDGQIHIKPGATLTLRDVIVKGVRSTKIVFDHEDGLDDGELILDGVRLDLSDSVAYTSGKVTVINDSTVVMQGHDLTFSHDAVLEVQRSALILNVLSNGATAHDNTVYAPEPVFVGHEKSLTNLSANQEAGNLILASGGVIAEVSQVLIASSVSARGPGDEVVLTDSTVLSPVDVIRFDTGATIDGNGSRITFSNTNTAQFVIAAGQTVALSNIELSNVTNATFSLGEGSVLQLGENVIFDITEDITWSSGKIVLTGTGNVCEIRSTGPRRTLRFQSLGTGDPHDLTYQTHLDLGANSAALRNIVLIGLRHIDYSTADVDDVTIVGDLVLGGDAIVDIAELIVPHAFCLEGLNNSIRLRNQNTAFHGAITFDDTNVSGLDFSFVLPLSVYQTPVLDFYDGVMNVSSSEGMAYCSFSSPAVRIANHVANAFTLGLNGVISGNAVTVSLNPILQTSARVTLMPGTTMSSALSGGAVVFDVDFLETMRSFGFHPRRRIPAHRYAKSYKPLTRAVSLPDESAKPVVHYNAAISLPVLAGNVMIDDSYGSTFNNLRIDAERAANITLKNGVAIQQAAAATTVKEGDILNIVGGTTQRPNMISLTNDFTFDGTLGLDDNAVLCFDCAASGIPLAINFSSTSSVSFGANSKLMFQGVGVISFADGYTLDFDSTDSSFIIGNGAQLYLNDSTLSLTGSGMLQCQDGGLIAIENGSEIRCGLRTDDVITLRAKNGGIFRVGDVLDLRDDGPSSYLSLTGCFSSLNCSQGGRLIIADRGICECNAYHGSTSALLLSAIDFSNGGSLYIAADGLLNIASNSGGGSGIALYLHGAAISGTGLVGVVGSAFRGKIQQNLVSQEDLTAREIVQCLVQTKTNLLVSTAYIDQDGQTSIRTKNGVLITLNAYQVVTSDNADGVVLGYNSITGKRFSYDADGVLR